MNKTQEIPVVPTEPQPRRTKWLVWAVRLLVLALLLWFLLHLKLDPAQVFDNLLHANLIWVILSVALVLPFIALKAWRWQIILKGLGLGLPFGAAYRLYAIGLSAGSFTPGQAGDAIKAWYLREHGLSLSAGLISIVLDRLFDVAVLIMLAASGLSLLGADFAGELPALVVLLGGTIAALVVLAVPALRNRLLDIALKVVLRKNRQTQPPPTENIVSTNTNSRIGPKIPTDEVQQVKMLVVFLLTITASLLALGRIWLLALALGLNLNPLQVIAASSLATVAALLPFSVGGIGVRDLALIGILGKLGYSQEQAVSLSSFILLLTLVNLVAGYLIWLTRPRKANRQP